MPKGFRILDLKVSKRRYIKNTFFGQQFTTAYQLNSYVHLEEEKTIDTNVLQQGGYHPVILEWPQPTKQNKHGNLYSQSHTCVMYPTYHSSGGLPLKLKSKADC